MHSADNNNLIIYTTTIPTTFKFRTLLHDPQYRVAIAWQNSCYNQPPHLGYYLGSGMATPIKPNITIVGGSGLVTSNEIEFENVSITNCFPNPFSESIQIYTEGNFDFEITNTAGVILEKGKGSDSKQVGYNLNSGIYLVKIQTNAKTEIVKITKK
jgi:rhamnogalacturonan endolyase